MALEEVQRHANVSIVIAPIPKDRYTINLPSTVTSHSISVMKILHCLRQGSQGFPSPC